MFRPVEVSAQFTRSRADGEWGTGVSPKVKTNIVPTAIGSWGVAISATASYDLITKENTALFVTVPATLRMSNACGSTSTPAGSSTAPPIATTSPMARVSTGAPPTMSGPSPARCSGRPAPLEQPGVVEPRFQLGLRYRPVDQFNIDLIYGRNLAGERANWITLATIVRFKHAGKISWC